MLFNIEDMACLFWKGFLTWLNFERQVISIDILVVLVLIQNKLGQLLLERLSFILEEIFILQLSKIILLFLIIIFSISFFWGATLFWLWVALWFRIALLQIMPLLVANELGEIVVGDRFGVAELLDVVLVKNMGDDLMIKILIRIQLDQLLIRSV